MDSGLPGDEFVVVNTGSGIGGGDGLVATIAFLEARCWLTLALIPIAKNTTMTMPIEAWTV